MLGANKFDLMLDYVAPRPPAGVDPEGYRRVRRAMGQKAIADARDAGLTFLRAAITGFGPVELNSRNQNDLVVWQTDPARFWAALDAMFADLDTAGVRLVPSFVWNLRQFPALANDNIATFIRDQNSASRRLLGQFLRDFITRYKGRPTILFYEMGNELNLGADIDMHKQCRTEPCVWGNFSTAEMDRFARDIAGLIKSLDPSRPVASGYSIPRGSASHLERRPQFSSAGPDWTADTVQEFDHNLLTIHQPFDVISIHVYPQDAARSNGPTSGQGFDPIDEAANAARSAGKRLFIGEFGDRANSPSFMAHVLDDIVRDRVDFAAIWVWEFYQQSTFTAVPAFNIEPGYTDNVIDLLAQTAKRLGTSPAPSRQSAPRVVLTWPLPCADISRPIDLAAVASDRAKPVNRVEFLIDGQPLGSAAAPPYRTAFNPAGRGSRLAELGARAVSAAGAAATFQAKVRLNGASGPCAVTP